MKNISTSAQIRLDIRNEVWNKPTAGLSPESVQVNLVILPSEDAATFHRFCHKNPKPCPVLGISEPGQRIISQLGNDLNICSDVPRYCVFEKGELIVEPTNIDSFWRDDLVTFAIGCSFTFEHMLIENGIRIKHIEQGLNVPMFKTNIETNAVGAFSGQMIVTMRPMKAADAIRSIQITSRYPGVHGAPVHIGDPALIGIRDINNPEYGDAVVVEEDEIPVFWACGATPQVILRNAKLPFCITHAPGYMLVTDLKNAHYSVL